MARQLFSNHPGSLFLICYASITPCPFFQFPMKTMHKAQSEPLSVGDFKHVYLQITRELGKRPSKKSLSLVFKPRDFWSLGAASEAVLLLPCLMGVDSHSQGFKEKCGGCRCVTAHRVLICSEEGGSNPDLFHPAAQRQGFFQEARCNTVH